MDKRKGRAARGESMNRLRRSVNKRRGEWVHGSKCQIKRKGREKGGGGYKTEKKEGAELV